ncbi:MAG TPA: MFS transporter [Anaerolineaceae bacterium]
MIRDLIILMVSMFTWGIGEGMFMYFQSIYLQQLGANMVTIGAILGGTGIAMGIAQIPAGFITDRIGPRPVLWASWIIGLIAAWTMALANSLPIFIIGLMLYGLTAFVSTPLNTYVSAIRGKWQLGRVLTLVSAGYNLGAAAGPFIGGILAEQAGLQTVYRTSAIIFILSTTMIFTLRAYRPETQNEHLPENHSVYKNFRFFVLLGLIFICVLASILPQPLTQNFLRDERGISLSNIGTLGTIASLGNSMIMLIFGGLPTRLGMAAGLTGLTIFSFMIWQGTSFTWYAIGYFFLGGFRLIRVMAVAYARPLVRAAQTGLAFGMVETTAAAAAVLAPIAAGYIYEIQPVYNYIIALVLLGFALLMNFLYRSPQVVKKTVNETINYSQSD